MDSAPDPGAGSFERALKEELDRRVAELGTYGDDTFGGALSGMEMIGALIAFFFAPILAVWLFR
jgi:hypothetical protein